MTKSVWHALLALLLIASVAHGAEPAEPLLRDLPPGLYLESSTELPRDQVRAIGQKLGGEVERLTNSVVRVHGRSIQVNVLAAVDETNARALEAAFAKIKPYPFALRKDLLVVEYVGRQVDAALALKTSYELGLLEKPTRVRYRVTAELALVDEADYMACTPLFNQFIALQGGGNQGVAEEISKLAQRFRFGRELVLRNPDLHPVSAGHDFQPPAPPGSVSTEATRTYTFDRGSNREDVPYVTATLELTVDETGITRSATAPSEDLTAATPFWPVNDPEIVALARKITAGELDDDGKVGAILAWLAPGKNLEYSGQTGSRWGTKQVIEQRFGHCWDFSDCFVTLARAAGVPSRQVAGWLYGGSGHVWAEYYREGVGWRQVDPTGGGALPCGIYHIPYFTSEDGEMPILYVSKPKIEPLNAGLSR